MESSTTLAQGKQKRKPGPALVKVDQVTLKPRATRQSFIGSLEPVRRAVIGSAVEERVEEVMVREGDLVVGGDARPTVLVQLHRQAIEIELEAAQIELDLRSAAMAELKATIPTQIEAAEAELARLEAQLEYTKQVYQRVQGLGSSMSEQEVEESVSLFNAATQSYNAAKAELARLTATREVRLLIATRNLERQKAELKRTEDLLSRYTVLAPFEGYVTRKMVERGNWVTKGTPLVEIIQLDPIELRIEVPQEYSVSLQQSFDSAGGDEPPLQAEIRIDSLQETLQGTVTRIIPDADPVTRTVPVIIRIPNAPRRTGPNQSHLLKPGMLARAELNIGKGQPVLMAPKDALVLNQGSASIYLVKQIDGVKKAKQIAVKTGRSNGNWIEITGDVNENDEIVVQGNERLRDGQAIKVLENMSVPNNRP
ncbi:MAG: efflux RND transporter periplasmic adaptor subunit [Pirellulaceae bacterium]|nr:efflux RND transporter periplasmic adaptor subunit [Pirellulaceae bacterium]MDG2105527.1 efflux RND transporter periplasmic adaptor subunit [Pirellulaceae bacterium]